LLSGTVQAPPIIHLHAAVFSGWLLLVIVQVSSGRRDRGGAPAAIRSDRSLEGAGQLLRRH